MCVFLDLSMLVYINEQGEQWAKMQKGGAVIAIGAVLSTAHAMAYTAPPWRSAAVRAPAEAGAKAALGAALEALQWPEPATPDLVVLTVPQVHVSSNGTEACEGTTHSDTLNIAGVRLLA